MFLTLTDFLAHFPTISIIKEEFVKKFIVTYSGRPTLEDLFNFKSVIKNTSDPRYINRDQIIDYFYDVVITNRHKYLTEFYKSYFGLPDFYGLKWDGVNIHTPLNVDFDHPEFISAWMNYLDDSNKNTNKELMSTQFNHLIDQPLSGLSLQKNDLSRKIIRNLNYLDILHNTRVTNTCKSKTSFWQTLINVYNKLELEDRFFAPSSIGLFLREKGSGGINYNNFFYLFQQYQPKASILNPYTVNWVLKNIFIGTKILTPVLSWDSYVVAFMHSDWDHYVGIDVIPEVCDKAKFVFDYYQTQLKPKLTSRNEIDRLNRKKIDIYCQPSELILNDYQFVSLYHDYFDAILLSSPYFDMELYQSPNQSTDLYPNYTDWLEKYWEGTVRGCAKALAPNGRFGFIINDYVSLKKEEYPLIHDLNMIALKYFKLIGVYRLLNRVSPLRVNYKGRTEMLFIYERMDQLPLVQPKKIKLKKKIQLKNIQLKK
jgi:hypothetical protein